MNKYDEIMKSLDFYYVRERPSISEVDNEIAEFERTINHELPSDYREFLKEYGLTGANHGPFLVRAPDNPNDKDGIATVEVFYGLGPSAGSYSLSNYARGSHAVLPESFLPIAKSAGGLVGLFLAGEHKGNIYWFNPFGGEHDPMDDAIFVARDFDSFMRSLFVKIDD